MKMVQILITQIKGTTIVRAASFSLSKEMKSWNRKITCLNLLQQTNSHKDRKGNHLSRLNIIKLTEFQVAKINSIK